MPLRVTGGSGEGQLRRPGVRWSSGASARLRIRKQDSPPSPASLSLLVELTQFSPLETGFP